MTKREVEKLLKMKSYYAIFRKTSEAIEVEFPDLQGCVTFGRSKDEAMENASDVLAGWLANAEPQFVKEPSSYDFKRYFETGSF